MEVLSYSIFEKFKMALRCPIYTPANQSNNRPTTRPWVTFGHLPWQYTLYNTITHIPDFDNGWPWMTLVDLGPSSVASKSSQYTFFWLCPWATLDDLGWPWAIFRDITLFKTHIFLTLSLGDLGWPWLTLGHLPWYHTLQNTHFPDFDLERPWMTLGDLRQRDVTLVQLHILLNVKKMSLCRWGKFIEKWAGLTQRWAGPLHTVQKSDERFCQSRSKGHVRKELRSGSTVKFAENHLRAYFNCNSSNQWIFIIFALYDNLSFLLSCRHLQ